MSSAEEIVNQLTKRDIFQTFVFENFQQASFNYETIHGLAFCVDMIPTIRRVYDKRAIRPKPYNGI